MRHHFTRAQFSADHPPTPPHTLINRTAPHRNVVWPGGDEGGVADVRLCAQIVSSLYRTSSLIVDTVRRRARSLTPAAHFGGVCQLCRDTLTHTHISCFVGFGFCRSVHYSRHPFHLSPPPPPERPTMDPTLTLKPTFTCQHNCISIGICPTAM